MLGGRRIGRGAGAFTPAELKPGIELVLEVVNFKEIISDADLVITGEGKIDGQSLRGKVPIGIADCTKGSGVPVIAIVGDVGKGLQRFTNAELKQSSALTGLPFPLPRHDYGHGKTLWRQASDRPALKVAGW